MLVRLLKWKGKLFRHPQPPMQLSRHCQLRIQLFRYRQLRIQFVQTSSDAYPSSVASTTRNYTTAGRGSASTQPTPDSLLLAASCRCRLRMWLSQSLWPPRHERLPPWLLRRPKSNELWPKLPLPLLLRTARKIAQTRRHAAAALPCRVLCNGLRPVLTRSQAVASAPHAAAAFPTHGSQGHSNQTTRCCCGVGLTCRQTRRCRCSAAARQARPPGRLPAQQPRGHAVCRCRALCCHCSTGEQEMGEGGEGGVGFCRVCCCFAPRYHCCCCSYGCVRIVLDAPAR